jgi:hypothetical protein
MIEMFIQLVQGWRELGAVGLGALAVAFVVGAMVFAPRPPRCVVSGLVFGFIAIPIVLLGSTLGSVLAFLLSRYLFRSRFLKIIERRPVWRALVEAIDAEGWRYRNKLPARRDSHRAVAIRYRNACWLTPADFPVRIYWCCGSNGPRGPFPITIAHRARCRWANFHCMGCFYGDETHKAVLAGYSIFHGRTRPTGDASSQSLRIRTRILLA